MGKKHKVNFWRSEPMVLLQMTMQKEAVHNTVDTLGELGMVQFKDLNYTTNAFQRQYANEIKRCDDMERKLRYFDSALQKNKSTTDLSFLPTSPENQNDDLDHLEEKFEKLESELLELDRNLEQMLTGYNSNKELTHVLRQGQQFFSLDAKKVEATVSTTGDAITGEESAIMPDSERSLLDDELPSQTNTRIGGLGFVTGVIPVSKKQTFVLLIFRATRGNMLPRFAQITEPMVDPATGEMVEKCVFIVFFNAERARLKIKKICESLDAHIHEYPEGDKMEVETKLAENLIELKSTIDSTQKRRDEILTTVGTNFEDWNRKVVKEKAIYHTMNKFNYTTSKHGVIAQGWCPTNKIDDISRKMTQAQQQSGAQVQSYCEIVDSKEVHPTYFITNKFTACFQQIIDAYGMARYQEVNPTILSIITFPFLFAVMFGDIGHGSLLTLFAIALILAERYLGKQELNDIVSMIFTGRYVLLLMGFFAIFTGWIYNDMFSLSWNIFGSTFSFPGGGDNAKGYGFGVKNAARTYWFGVDPGWLGTENKILFYNSFKMKLSVIFGVSQMLVGIIIKVTNDIHFKQWLDVIFEFFPEFIFLSFTFGYMNVMIILKWLENKNQIDLLNTMTGFFLAPLPFTVYQGGKFGYFNVPVCKGGNEHCQLFPGQNWVQFVLVIVAVIQLPILLIPKPIIEFFHHKIAHKNSHHHSSKVDDSTEGLLNDNEYNPDENVDEEDNGEDAEEQHAEQQSDDIVIDENSTSINGDSVQDIDDIYLGGVQAEEIDEDDFKFSELLIKQVIHTIEFALGCVSNTASYLRLWALSLAHAELAEVFFNLTIGTVLNIDLGSGLLNSIVDYSGILLVVAWSGWMSATIVVLMIMEALSAFLHALRLHWVEFQNKFYYGDGIEFNPFSFEKILSGKDEDE